MTCLDKFDPFATAKSHVLQVSATIASCQNMNAEENDPNLEDMEIELGPITLKRTRRNATLDSDNDTEGEPLCYSNQKVE